VGDAHPTVNQPIAIVGASTRAAAASALRAGFQPIAADLFADADLRAIATTTRISPYPDGLVDWLRATEPPAWMYTGALENHPELVDQMAWVAPLWGNPGDVLDRVRSPRELANALRDAGLLFPETRDSADGLPRDGSWLAKTYRGASGSGVRVPEETGRGGDGETGRFEVGTHAAITPPLPFSPSPHLFYQRRIPGIPCAAAFVAIVGTAELLGVTRQLIGESWLGAHGFQYAGSIGPLPIPETALKTILQIGQVLADRFELVGLFGIDLVFDGERVWPIEVNPRYTASMEICERVEGVHVIAAHVAGCTDASVNSLQTSKDVPKHAHGKAIMFAKQDIVISEEFAAMALAEALRSPWPTLADVSPAGTPIEAGRPIISVFADGSNLFDVDERLRKRVAELEQQIYTGEVLP
jgi:predicted ATP-grasp superfamily ATP-dependent carboligase